MSSSTYANKKELEALGPEFGVMLGDYGGDFRVVKFDDFVLWLDSVVTGGGSTVTLQPAVRAPLAASTTEGVTEKGIADALASLSGTFAGLTDTPALAGQAGRFVRINATSNALEYVALLATLIQFDNGTANIPGSPANVQAAIESLKALVDGLPDQLNGATFADLPGTADNNSIIHIADASGDPGITSGWAKYRYDGAAWELYLSQEDISIVALTTAQVIDGDSTVTGTVTGEQIKAAIEAHAPKDRVFADDTTVAPATAGQPTESEISAFAVAGSVTDTLIYYTGTDAPGDTATRVYHVDKSGNITSFVSPEDLINFATDDLTGPASETRAHTFDAALQIIGGGQKTIISNDGTGRFTLIDANNGQATFQTQNTNGANTSTGMFQASALPASAFARVQANDPVSGGTTKLEAQGDKLLIYTPAIDAGTTEVGQVLVLKDIATGEVEYEQTGADLLFIDETTLAPTSAGEPTIAEVTTFIGTERDRFAFYTSTDTATDSAIAIYYVDKSGGVIQIEKVQEEGLRGSPVADNAALTALPARDYERRKVTADGKEYVFQLGAVSGTLADDAATGFWQEQIASGLVTTYIDSSAGATVTPLPSSTNAGVVRLFTNQDVTNAATLAVAAGETLNGVTDSTFLFSNYSAGTQFRADEVSGGWVVSVVGASSQTELAYVGSHYGNNQLIQYIGGHIDLTQASEDFFDNLGLVQSNPTKIIVPKDGIYNIEYHYEQTSPNPLGRIDRNGSRIGTTPNVGTTNQPTRIAAYLGELSEGDEIQFHSTETNGQQRNASIRFQQLPTTESVLAGMVAPEGLDYLYLRSFDNVTTDLVSGAYFLALDDSDFSVYDPAGLIDGPNNKVVITKDGPYEINWSQGDASGHWFYVQKNGVRSGVLGYEGDDGGSNLVCFGILDLVAGDELSFEVGSSSVEPNQVNITIKQLPSSTIVLPESLDVGPNETTLLTGAQGLTGTPTQTLIGGVTWEEVKSEYSHVRFEFQLGVTSVGDVQTTEIINTADIVAGMRMRPVYGAAHVNWEIGATTGGTIIPSTPQTLDDYGIRAIGIKAQKTVLNTTDLPVAGVASWSDGDQGVWNNGQFEPIVITEELDTAVAEATLNQLTGTTWTVDTGTNPGTGAVFLGSCQYTQEGNRRYYVVDFRTDEDDAFSFEVVGAQDVYRVSVTSSAGSFNQAATGKTGTNEISVDRSNIVDADHSVRLTFMAIM